MNKLISSFALLLVCLVSGLFGLACFSFGMGRFFDRRKGGWPLLGLAALLLSVAGFAFWLHFRVLGFH